MSLISFESGGDWYDASYKIVKLKVEKDQLKSLYCKYLDLRKIEDSDFPDWLIKNDYAESVDIEFINVFEDFGC